MTLDSSLDELGKLLEAHMDTIRETGDTSGEVAMSIRDDLLNLADNNNNSSLLSDTWLDDSAKRTRSLDTSPSRPSKEAKL